MTELTRTIEMEFRHV